MTALSALVAVSALLAVSAFDADAFAFLVFYLYLV
jgi:hypothetical protein